MGADAHTFWLNTRALEECGITKDTEVAFGEIGKDRDGELTGLLFEIEAAATANKNAFILPGPVMKKLQTDFLRALAENGITSTTDMSASPVQETGFKEYEIAQELEKEGRFDDKAASVSQSGHQCGCLQSQSVCVRNMTQTSCWFPASNNSLTA